MNAHFFRLLKDTLKHAAFVLLLCAAATLFVGCDDIAGLFGNAAPVSCNITGKVVGEDGGQPAKVDIQWVPAAELSQSFELIQVSIQDDGSFSISELVVEQKAQNVLGELRFGEEAIPPLPLKYEQVSVPIDLESGNCVEDLGEILLPLQGTGGNSSDNSGGTTGGDTSNGTTDGSDASNATDETDGE